MIEKKWSCSENFPETTDVVATALLNTKISGTENKIPDFTELVRESTMWH